MRDYGTRPRTTVRSLLALLVVSLAAFLLPACSLNRMAVNVLGDALAESGGVYSSDDDPELIRDAIPFGLKTYESLLAVSPEHRGLLLSASSGFAAYAYILQDEADRLDIVNLVRSRELRSRAHNLYCRGRDFALRGLEASHPGFITKLKANSESALAITTKDDVPFLYWAGASWAAGLTAAKDDLDLIAELPIAGVLVGRALELDETYDLGAAHEFFISYEASRPGGSSRLAREHYRRALEISRGQRASAHLALAEAVMIREQNLGEFRALLTTALTVDPDRVPSLRLANTIARRRAQWLQTRIPDLFLGADEAEEAK